MNETIETHIPILKSVPLFANLSDDELKKIADVIDEIAAERSAVLCQKDTPGKHLYVIKSGRVKVSVPAEGERETILASLGAGEYFGEMSLLTGDCVSATVTASLDCQLLTLSRTDFDRILEENPSITRQICRTLSRRLHRTNLKIEEEGTRPPVISVFGGYAGLSDGSFAFNLALALRTETSQKVGFLELSPDSTIARSLALKVDSPSLACFFKATDLIAHQEKFFRTLSEYQKDFSPILIPKEMREHGKPTPAQIPQLISMLTARNRHVVINCGNELDKLTLKTLLQSDLILFMVSSHSQEADTRNLRILIKDLRETGIPLKVGCDPSLFESLLEEFQDDIDSRNIFKIPVAVDHPENFFLRGVPMVELGTHVPLCALIGRLCREISGVCIGIALGGGGARGFAHIGVLKVLESAGIPVDLIAGSSMGAVVGARYALGEGTGSLEEIMRNEWTTMQSLFRIFDYQLPRTALIRGRRMRRVGKNIFGDTRFSQLIVPCYIVCADLISGEEVVLDRGLVLDAVIASSSIPGIMKPVRLDEKYLVDGAVLNKIPSNVVKERGANVVLAVNVTPKTDFAFNRRAAAPPEGVCQKLFAKTRLLRTVLEDPNILQIISRSLSISNIRLSFTKQHVVDVQIKPDIEQFDFFDFKNFSQLVEAGEVATTQALDEIHAAINSLKVT